LASSVNSGTAGVPVRDIAQTLSSIHLGQQTAISSADIVSALAEFAIEYRRHPRRDASVTVAGNARAYDGGPSAVLELIDSLTHFERESDEVLDSNALDPFAEREADSDYEGSITDGLAEALTILAHDWR
jgi:hypothetical protein